MSRDHLVEAVRALVKGAAAEQLGAHLRQYDALRDALQAHDEGRRAEESKPTTFTISCKKCGAGSPSVAIEDDVVDAAVDAGWMIKGQNEEDLDLCPTCREADDLCRACEKPHPDVLKFPDALPFCPQCKKAWQMGERAGKAAFEADEEPRDRDGIPLVLVECCGCAERFHLMSDDHINHRCPEFGAAKATKIQYPTIPRRSEATPVSVPFAGGTLTVTPAAKHDPTLDEAILRAEHAEDASAGLAELVTRYHGIAGRLWKLFPSDPLGDDPAQSWCERLEALLDRGLLVPRSAAAQPRPSCGCDANSPCERHAAEGLWPLPIVLACPLCGQQHIDEGEWTTRPHKVHRCVAGPFGKGCGHEWRPTFVATFGVTYDELQRRAAAKT